MNDLLVKQVNFQNVNMTACKTTDDKVFVGIKSICDGLGVAYNGQTERINRDDVLPEGVRKIRIPTGSGEQETNMLDIEYVPFFLIGIKSSMCRKEIRPRLKDFKLKAKEELAKAFIKPNDNMKIVSMLHAEIGELIAETNKHGERIEHLENNMTIDYGQQQTLQEIAKKVALESMGGKEMPAYKNKSVSSKVFAQVWKDYKEYFKVNSYKNTPRIQYQKAKYYLLSWKAQGATLRTIEDANNQITFSKEAF